MEVSWVTNLFRMKNPKMYQINFDYRLEDVDTPSGKKTLIHLLIPEYRDVEYFYHGARIVEEEGLARLQYAYTIVSSGKHVLNSDEKLFTIMGDILQQIILKKIEHEQTGKDNTEELDL